MGYIFESTLNTRPILEDSLKYVRSDVPTVVTEKEKLWLLEKNITVFIDLRTEEERLKKECPLEKDGRFQYYCMPITGGNTIPQSVDDVSKSYINMVDETLYRTINLILGTKSNVLYFCNAGKDRTGIVSAILLHKLGMELAYIIDDYMKSKTNLKCMLDSFVKQNPTVNIDVITPHERYIEEFLKWFIRNETR